MVTTFNDGVSAFGEKFETTKYANHVSYANCCRQLYNSLPEIGTRRSNSVMRDKCRTF